MVLARVGNYLMNRIPEIVDVSVADEAMLLEENNVDEDAPTGTCVQCIEASIFDAPELSLRHIRPAVAGDEDVAPWSPSGSW